MPRPKGEEETPETEETALITEDTETTEMIREPLSEPRVPLSAHLHAASPAAPVGEEKRETLDETQEDAYPFLRVLYAFFSPFLAPTIATLWLFNLTVIQLMHPGSAAPYALTVLGATCIVPVIAILILLKVGAIKSVDILRRRERILPYCLQIIALGAVTFFFLYQGAPYWLWTVFCGAAAVGAANLILNFFLRVSNHCSAMAGLVAVLLVISRYGMPVHPLTWWVIGTIAAGGVAGAFAIIVGRHSVWEVLAGYATGFLGIFLFTLIH